jgi:hypothetical protein
MPAISTQDCSHIHYFYRLLFLYVEPTILLAGAYIAFFLPTTYLSTVHAIPTFSSSPITSHPTTALLLAQLTNVYILFFLLETTILRTTPDTRVWGAFLRAALVADLGHLAIVAGFGVGVGWGTLGRVHELGLADWGKPGFMLVSRCAFLMGVGVMERSEVRDENGRSR